MTNPNDRRVHFDIPMDDESGSQAPSSNAGDNPTMMYFGFDTLPVPSNTGSVAAPYQMDFGFTTPPTAPPVPQPVFNFGFNPGTDLSPTPPPAAPTAHALAGPPAQPYKLNFGFEDRQPTPPVPQPVFDFGFSTIKEASPTPQPATPAVLDFGWRASVAGDDPVVTPVAKPFNFGMDLDVNPQRSVTPPAILIENMSSPPTTMPAFDFGWTLSPTSTPAHPVHVGYDISNKRMTPFEAFLPFPFNCQVPPAKVGDWQPMPVKAAAPVKAADPATALPVPAEVAVAYTPMALPNVGFPFPKRSSPSSSSDTPQPRPSLQRVITEAEKTAKNIVERLQGDEFDKLAQLMLGSIVNPGDDVRHPKPDEVLDSNRVIISVFCESRDKLTRIFKDLIHLHHMAAVQARVVPMVNSLSQQVQKAEGRSDGDD
ncbi:hypothetical protein C8R48DRAFT_679735 [Suillus tomentosus]|nr:hypothetical protein C8R48DRAFT_679735 [Suillus tomentosus]